MRLRRSVESRSASDQRFRTEQAVRAQVLALNNRPINAFTPIEAEAYMQLLVYASLMAGPPPIGVNLSYQLVLDGREHARQLVTRYIDDAQVHCAWLNTEARLANDDGLAAYSPQIKQGKLEAETALTSFLEDVLAGKRQVNPDFSVLRYRLGQLYVDQGFYAMRVEHDMKRAGDKFEAGGKQLILAAAQARSSLGVNNWQRYNTAISRLKNKEQWQILKRLHDYANTLFADKDKLSEREMCAYTFVLETYADAAMQANQAADAASAFKTYNELLHRLRLLDKRNQNYESREVSGFYSLGEAYTSLGQIQEAKRQYRNAIEAASRVSEDSKTILEADGYLNEIRKKTR